MNPPPDPPKTLTFRYPLTFRVVETAKANGVNPWAYLKNVFTALPSATTVT